MVPSSITCAHFLLRKWQNLDLKIPIFMIEHLNMLIKHIFARFVYTLQNMVAPLINSFTALRLPLSYLLVDLAHSYIFVLLTL